MTVSPHRQRLQPLLHDLTVTVSAPVSALSGHDGQIRGDGVQGVFYADLRALSRAVLRVDGAEPEPVMHTLDGPHSAWFVALVRGLGGSLASSPDGAPAEPEPAIGLDHLVASDSLSQAAQNVRVDRIRRVTPDGLAEEIRVASTGSAPVRATVAVDLGCDLAPMAEVRRGGTGTEQPARRDGAGLVWSTSTTSVYVTAEDAVIDAGAGPGAVRPGAVQPVPAQSVAAQSVAAQLVPAQPGDVQPGQARLVWPVEVPPGQTVTLRWRVRVVTTAAAVAPARGPVEWGRPDVVADDRRLVRLLRRSLDDLAALRLAEPAGTGDTFLGAGVPWYLTLFGRDSIWAARMLLPTGTTLAAGTLRTLARRQGLRVDASSGEEPGKIMHELRYGGLFGVRADDAPAAYYGTVDATALWISLLHDAWRWGMPEAEVAALLPNLGSALDWLARYGDPDGDGFVRYLDRSGRGLANQGWKDSGDAVRFRDGRIAAGPIALCEVQGYAYQAAVHGAALLSAFGLPGEQQWREYAADLAHRFRDRFWVDGPDGPYPALALDRDGRPVDALTSNIGHLLGTGLLDDAESARVARALAGPALSGGYGLRTMSTMDAAFDPLSYHCGSVWPHDTAIAVSGLARAGYGAEAAGLVEGVLAAAEAFGYRLPELYGGDDRATLERPVPYPAACRPQAWSATASIAILAAGLGLEPDVPRGELRLRPMAGAPLGAITARGLRIAGQPVDVTLDGAGRVSVDGLPDSVRVVAPVAPSIPVQPQDGSMDSPAAGDPVASAGDQPNR
ncbi:amylo-alpha-1,6-glucosidase [Rugosimonospora africana]|uniref:Amylo-alpha-1,6-glucosidase n=1 Tax=Rugosimonospora africana TaxID=556532 RepID=A0A8J3VT87_9ACTN|nr:glycogen debranching N-terminal domain-containing protein [Rugosimonospora africana]GIH17935.1 amylo-alpha-1,6-glucosidase [Rugosimonospora africana]